MPFRKGTSGSTSRNGTVSAACSPAQGGKLELRSKSDEDLTRYFPELVEAALELKAIEFRLDGEIVVPHGKMFSFDDLLQRIHPAASRVKKLAQETPALLLAFDLLATAKDKNLSAQPLAQRRPALEAFAKSQFKSNPTFRLSQATKSYATATKWLAQAGGGCDGVIAKRLDLPYQAGSRDGMQKIKNFRSADCVIGGFRYASKLVGGKKVVGSLLLGLYDEAGLLHHVGFSSAIKQHEKAALTAKLGTVDRKARLHRQRAGRPEPLVHRTVGAVVPAEAEAGRRGQLRSFQRRPVSPRHLDPALAAGQGAEAVHFRSAETEGGQSDEAAGLNRQIMVTWSHHGLNSARSPDGAKRNPGDLPASKPVPDCASLHPGYGTALYRVQPVASTEANSAKPLRRASAAIAS